MFDPRSRRQAHVSGDADCKKLPSGLPVSGGFTNALIMSAIATAAALPTVAWPQGVPAIPPACQ